MRHKIYLLLLLSGVATIFGQTIYGDMVMPAGAFLMLNNSAQIDALGGSSTAFGGLKSAGTGNPSALFDEQSFIAGASYSYIRSKTNSSSLFSAKRHGSWAGALRLFLMNSDDIEARSGPTADPDYTFSSHQLYLQLVAAKRFQNIIDLGASAKWVHERIDQDSRQGWVFDFGATGHYKFLSAGASVQNYGKEVVFRMYRERYPLTYRLGLSADILDYGAITADYIKPDRLSGWFAIGAEYRPVEIASLRVGYTPGHDTRNISAGFGIFKSGMELDYAVVNYSEGLGLSHQVSLSYSPRR